MKHAFILFALLFSSIGYGQEVLPMLDFNNLMKSFEDGIFRSVALQPISGLKVGDNIAAYVDFRTNLVVYDGDNPETISNVEAAYQVSDNLLTWQIATTLNVWDDGEQQTLSFRVGKHEIRDSLVVFEDLRYNAIRVYYDGEIYDLITSSTDLVMPDFIGENIVAFKENGNFYKVFWRGKIYDLDVWHNPYKFSGGTDILAFNDPINGTFAIFENGAFYDVETFHMRSYKAGNGLVAYENQNGDLKVYEDGEVKTLSNFQASFWEVKDNIVFWGENGFTYAYTNGQKVEVSKYIPKDYELKNNVVAFRNIMGGVSAVQDGKVYEISNQMDAKYSIHGNSVLVELFNKSYVVLQGGKKFTN